jgi:serine/threonine protein kinase
MTDHATRNVDDPDPAGHAGFLEGSIWDLVRSSDVSFTSDPTAQSISYAVSQSVMHPDIHPGATLGRYRLENQIGTGGSSVVYRAIRVSPVERAVAIKFLLRRTELQHEASRFDRECQILAELDHPGLARILDSGTTASQIPYLVMPLIEGVPIHQYCERHRCSEAQIAELLVRVCRAIEHAHQRGTIHRDITPNNILVQDDGTPVVTDFGLARWLDAAAPRTVTGAVLGTPGYLAPEQCDQTDPASSAPTVDVYGIGATLYCLLTGRPPFRESTLIATIMSLQYDIAEPPSRLNASVSADIELICLKCLHKDPTDRYANVGQLGDDLQRFARGLGVKARPLPLSKRVVLWCRANQLAACLAGALGVTIIASLIGLTLLWISASQRYQQAEANLELANHSLHSLFSPINALVKTEKDLTEKSRLLEQTLKLYEPVIERQPGNEKLRSEYATTWFQYGSILYMLGEAERSGEARLRALELFTQLRAEFPEEDDYQFSRFHCMFAMLALNRREYLYPALDLIRGLARRHPMNADYLDAAAAIALTAPHHFQPDDLETMKQYIQEGAMYANRISDEAIAAKPSLMRHRGTAAHMRGEIAMRESEFSLAATSYQRAIEAMQRLIDFEPDNQTYHYDLQAYRMELASALMRLERMEEAAELLEAAIDGLQTLMEETPDRVLFGETMQSAKQLLEQTR